MFGKSKKEGFSLKDALFQTSHVAEPLIGREKGLSYIMNLLERGEIIKVKNIQIFLKDLGLPRMSRSTIEQELLEVGGNSEGITRLTQFFKFIRNQLVTCEPEQIVESFMAFDKDEIGFISIEDMRLVLTALGDPIDGYLLNKVLRMVDMDGDGTINYEEVLKTVANNEGHLDDDGALASKGVTDEAALVNAVEAVENLENLLHKTKAKHSSRRTKRRISSKRSVSNDDPSSDVKNTNDGGDGKLKSE